MRRLSNHESVFDNDRAEMDLPEGELRFIEFSDTVASRPKTRLTIEHDAEAPVRRQHIEFVDIEADKDDSYSFSARAPEGNVLFARIHGGMRRNHLQLLINVADDHEIERSFLFFADDGEVPEDATFIDATRPAGTSGAWAIYETTAHV